jgi:hypothetical protein
MLNPRTLHIANGTSVTGTLDPIAVPGDRMIWCDPLHDGPVPADVPDAELRRVRAAFLAGSSAAPEASREEILVELERADQQVADAARYDEVVLWYEHDLFDQLNLIQLLERLSRVSPRPVVTLICIDAHPNHPRFKGLGELSATELTALLPRRAAVTDAQYVSASTAWRAFRSPDPRDIERWLETDTGALPFLAPALRRHLEEFPWTTTGLSRREGRALALLRNGDQTTWELFRQFDGDDRTFYVTDTSLLEVLTRLASATPPLVEMGQLPDESAGLPNVPVKLSPAGAQLSGDLHGIKKWLGGVYITGRGPAWRWDPAGKRLIHP